MFSLLLVLVYVVSLIRAGAGVPQEAKGDYGVRIRVLTYAVACQRTYTCSHIRCLVDRCWGTTGSTKRVRQGLVNVRIRVLIYVYMRMYTYI